MLIVMIPATLIMMMSLLVMIGPEVDEMPVENPNIPTVSSDKWMKVAHLNELTTFRLEETSIRLIPLLSYLNSSPAKVVIRAL